MQKQPGVLFRTFQLVTVTLVCRYDHYLRMEKNNATQTDLK